MTETSRFWDGTVVGDATTAPYDSHTEFAKVLNSASTQARKVNNGGVCFGELNELVCTGIASPVSVDTGRAFVYGTWYENDASVSVAVATPGGATRIDRIVLRKSWAAQTVRITLIAGGEGTGVPPAITQTAGTTWDIPLYQVSITVGGVITLIDEREINQFAYFGTRQGGSSTSFYTVGNTNRAITKNVKIFFGRGTSVMGPVGHFFTNITFPEPFTEVPFVMVDVVKGMHDNASIDATTMVFETFDSAGLEAALDFSWIAIGPVN